jgi:hypothetical protein
MLSPAGYPETGIWEITPEKHRMGRPNRDGINSLPGVVNQESALRLEFCGLPPGWGLRRLPEPAAFSGTYPPNIPEAVLAEWFGLN